MSSLMSSMGERLRRLSGRAASEPETPTSPGQTTSPREGNPWRGVFDPNYNPNIKNVGRSYYDTVDEKTSGSKKSVWDYHLDSEQAKASTAQDVKKAAFQAMGTQNDVLDADSLRKMFTADRVDQIMSLADKNKDGRIDFKEFCDLIRKYPCD